MKKIFIFLFAGVIIVCGLFYLNSWFNFRYDKNVLLNEIKFVYVTKSIGAGKLSLALARPYLDPVEYGRYLERTLSDLSGNSHLKVMGDICFRKFDEWTRNEILCQYGHDKVDDEKMLREFFRKTPRNIILNMRQPLQAMNIMQICFGRDNFDRTELKKTQEDFIRSKMAFAIAFAKAQRYKEKIKS